jgi:hypothetical protein
MTGNGEPYNPLDTRHLGEAVARALLARPVHRLPPERRVAGGGIYAIYYTGDFALYYPIAARNRDDQFQLPIYAGKAVPKGRRTGGGGVAAGEQADLYSRLGKHAASISAAENLDLADFYCRYLVVEPVWIPLAEELVIRWFAPLWNKIVHGFGNNPVGGKRSDQKRSLWDVLHPGRASAASGANPQTLEDISERVRHHLAQLDPQS